MTRSLLDATEDEMLQALARYNWPAGGGRFATPGHEANYRRGMAEAGAVLAYPAPELGPNPRELPDVPDELVRQRNAWSCAVRAMYAALWDLAAMGAGDPVTYGDDGPRDVYAWMVPSIDDASVGLHYADGHELVALLTAKGYPSGRKVGATLADVQARAGVQPVLCGFRGWGAAGHWVYVRGVEIDGTLMLENPAGTYVGISNELRDSFDRIGPCTMVWIDVAAPAPSPDPGPKPITPDAERIATLQAQVDGLRSVVGYLCVDLLEKRLAAVAADLTAVGIELASIRAEAARVREQFIGKAS